MKYTQEELEILEVMENGTAQKVEFNNDEIVKMASQTLDYLNEKKQISINLKRSELDFIKQRANDIGISYQNIIQALVHNYSTNKLKLHI